MDSSTFSIKIFDFGESEKNQLYFCLSKKVINPSPDIYLVFSFVKKLKTKRDHFSHRFFIQKTSIVFEKINWICKCKLIVGFHVM